jgi:type I restriction enzyme S subunit
MIKRIMIKDICDVYDGPHATPRKTDKGPVYLGIRAISDDGTLLSSEFAFLSEDDYKKWTKRVTPKENDIVFSYEATLDRYAIIPKGFYGCLGRRLAIIRARSDEVNINWLFYYFKSSEWKTFIANHIINGSTVNRISIDDFPFYPVSLPERADQDRIVTILRNIDHKIHFNIIINMELEKLAKTLYNYWFLQFDFPNTKGKPYRASGGKMEYNDVLKREIPKGWKADKLNDKLSLQRGVEPGSDSYSKVQTETHIIPFIRVSDLGSEAALYISESAASGTRCKPTDVLVSFDGSVGKIGIAMEGAFSSGIRKITKKNDGYSDALIYFIFQSDEIQKTIAKYAIGSNILHAAGAIEHLFFPYDKDVVNAYIEKVEPVYQMIVANNLQNKELVRLRDFLLPLLMNGQVTVREVPVAKEQLTKRQEVFIRLLLSAYILDNICDEPTSGKVKFEKLLFLCLYCAKIPIKSNFSRKDYGPYDHKAFFSIEKGLKDNKWFQSKVKDKGKFYIRLEKFASYKKYVKTNFDLSQKTAIDKLLHILKPATTEQCEIVATLYAAWNDFLIDGIQPSDEQIVNEVLTNWSERKESIDRQRWFIALEWMREKDIIPVGYGASTKR